MPSTLFWVLVVAALVLAAYFYGRASAGRAANRTESAPPPPSSPPIRQAVPPPARADTHTPTPTTTVPLGRANGSYPPAAEPPAPPRAPAPPRSAPPPPARADAGTPAPPTAPPRMSTPPLATATRPPAATSGARRPRLADIRSWGYQLQHLDIAKAAASPFDLLVIDYAKDGSDETRLRPVEIERLKRKPDGSQRLVIAYMSIGEAESYRFYWDDDWKKHRPGWLLRENPEWKENYSVCFWDPGWQSVVCGTPDSYLDRIIAQGFDGVYLDKCDVYEDIANREKRVAATRPDIARDMVGFVRAISSHAKSIDPEFLVIMQNAEGLLEHGDLRMAIDGLGKEDLVYGVDGAEKKNGRDDIEWSTNLLAALRREGKPVFVVEYLNNLDKVRDAKAITDAAGFVLYISSKDRELARLNYETHQA
jgi:cysteinyl-tRNA synthetase